MFDPMKIARPYVNAIFQIAKERKSFEFWKSFLSFITSVVEEKSVNLFLKNPTVSASTKATFLKSIYKSNFDDIVIDNFIFFLASKKRLLFLPTINILFLKNLFSEKKIVQVSIETALLNLNDLRKNVCFFLRKIFGENIDIINEKVNEKLIGGVLIITANNKVIDATFCENLKRLKRSFEMF